MIDYGKLFRHTSNLSLLIIEDYEPLLDELHEMLEDYFDSVVCARDGEEGLDKYRQYYQKNHSYFDIIISDINMPKINGVDLSEKVLKINYEQKIIILSAHTESKDLLRLINMGVSKFIKKPIKDETLFETLSLVCEDIPIPPSADAPAHIILFGEHHRWDRARKSLVVESVSIELSQHECMLLELLIEYKNRACNNEDIMQNFYLNDIDINKRSIRNLIYKLRKRLPEDTITSLYGTGYRLNIIDSRG